MDRTLPPPRIVIMDEDDQTHWLARELLTPFGFSIVSCLTLATAQVEVTNPAAKVFLIDLQHPQLQESLEKISPDGRLLLPTVGLTLLPPPEREHRNLFKFGVDILLKPLVPTKFIPVILRLSEKTS